MKPWRRLRNIIDRLPRQGSAYAEALAQDDEVAEAAARARAEAEEKALAEGRTPPAPPRWTPRVSEWGIREEMTATVIDRLGEVGTLIRNQRAKSKIRPPKRYPRPETARDRVEQRQLEAYTASLDADYAAATARYEARRSG